MSGHSHWTQIKRQKGAADAKRGTLFTKLARAVTVAAHQGGGQPETNERLRLAIERARAANMPLASLERAIRRGTGELDTEGEHIKEVLYEGYGPGGAAVLVQTMTNNRNRTAAELRRLFSKYGGSLGGANSVNWMFTSRGVITIAPTADREKAVLAAIDAGARDVEEDGEITIYTEPKQLTAVTNALQQAGVPVSETTIEPVPTNATTLDQPTTKQLERFFGELQELEDVNNFFTNAQT